MPRKARVKSESGIYHIILRGNIRQEIFHDEEDCHRFLEIIEKYRQKSEMKMYGWCLMSNHVHLLLGEGAEKLSTTIKRIGVSFVWYYNKKYNTTGHLFQDRFKSENVEDDKYLLTVVRYIHQNPVKAKVVKRVDEWEWSSYLSYTGYSSNTQILLDRDFVLDIFSEDKNKAIIDFKNFNESENNDKCLEHETQIHITDDKARQIIMDQLAGLEILEIKSLPKVQRNEVLNKIKEIDGITQRQIARILGISPNLIFKAKKEAKEPSFASLKANTHKAYT